MNLRFPIVSIIAFSLLTLTGCVAGNEESFTGTWLRDGVPVQKVSVSLGASVDRNEEAAKRTATNLMRAGRDSVVLIYLDSKTQGVSSVDVKAVYLCRDARGAELLETLLTHPDEFQHELQNIRVLSGDVRFERRDEGEIITLDVHTESDPGVQIKGAVTRLKRYTFEPVMYLKGLGMLLGIHDPMEAQTLDK